MPSKRKRKEAPGPFTGAGLVRFYEEADVGIKMKPQVIIFIAIALTIAVIALQKLYPIG
ncbi:MAG: preprotein translocase subunit Sec61beta [Desulfurococcales archaeon]|nr:preprotein translocase subunit Sec61beta [Desulfurococcales archaeon]